MLTKATPRCERDRSSGPESTPANTTADSFSASFSYHLVAPSNKVQQSTPLASTLISSCVVQFNYQESNASQLFASPTRVEVQLRKVSAAKTATSHIGPDFGLLFSTASASSTLLWFAPDGVAELPLSPNPEEFQKVNSGVDGETVFGPHYSRRISTVRAVRRAGPSTRDQHSIGSVPAAVRQYWLPFNAIRAISLEVRDKNPELPNADADDEELPLPVLAEGSPGQRLGGLSVLLQCCPHDLTSSHCATDSSAATLQSVRMGEVPCSVALSLVSAYDAHLHERATGRHTSPCSTSTAALCQMKGCGTKRPTAFSTFSSSLPPSSGVPSIPPSVDWERDRSRERLQQQVLGGRGDGQGFAQEEMSGTTFLRESAPSAVPTLKVEGDVGDMIALRKAGVSEAFDKYARILGLPLQYTGDESADGLLAEIARGNNAGSDEKMRFAEPQHLSGQLPETHTLSLPTALTGQSWEMPCSHGRGTSTNAASSDGHDAASQDGGSRLSHPQSSPADHKPLATSTISGLGSPQEEDWSEGRPIVRTLSTSSPTSLVTGEDKRRSSTLPPWFPPAPEISDASYSAPPLSRRHSPLTLVSATSSQPLSPPAPLRGSSNASGAARASPNPDSLPNEAAGGSRVIPENFTTACPSVDTLAPRHGVTTETRLPPSGVPQAPQLGFLRYLTAEQRDLVDFDRVLRPVTSPTRTSHLGSPLCADLTVPPVAPYICSALTRATTAAATKEVSLGVLPRRPGPMPSTVSVLPRPPSVEETLHGVVPCTADINAAPATLGDVYVAKGAMFAPSSRSASSELADVAVSGTLQNRSDPAGEHEESRSAAIARRPSSQQLQRGVGSLMPSPKASPPSDSDIQSPLATTQCAVQCGTAPAPAEWENMFLHRPHGPFSHSMHHSFKTVLGQGGSGRGSVPSRGTRSGSQELSLRTNCSAGGASGSTAIQAAPAASGDHPEGRLPDSPSSPPELRVDTHASAGAVPGLPLSFSERLPHRPEPLIGTPKLELDRGSPKRSTSPTMVSHAQKIGDDTINSSTSMAT